MRKALWVYAALVLALLFLDSLGRQGFSNQSVCLRSASVDLKRARLALASLNIHVDSLPFRQSDGSYLFVLQSRSLISANLELPGGAYRAGALVRATYREHQADLVLGPDGRASLAPLFSAYRIQLPGRDPFYLDLDSMRLGDKAVDLLLGTLFIILAWVLSSRLSMKAVLRPSQGAATLAAVLALAFLALAEWQRPWAFLDNDNYAQFMPKIQSGLESLFAGHFPFLDPYQGFGMPIFEVGTYAILDPLMILSYALARTLDQPGFLFELYAVLSLSLASALTAALLERLKVGRLLALSAGLAFGLAPYFLGMGKMWYYVLGIGVYVPALAHFFLRALERRPGWSWWLGSGLLRACFFFAGNVQFFTYGCLIEASAYAWLAWRRGRWDGAVAWLGSSLLSLGLILPQLLAQFVLTRQTQRWHESAFSSTGVPFEGLISAAIPWHTGLPNYFLPSEQNHAGVVYFIGPLWLLVFGACLWRWWRGKAVPAPPLLGLAAFLLSLSLGRASLIYLGLHYVPLIRDFRYIFKLLPFATFAIVVYAALALRDLRWKWLRLALAGSLALQAWLGLAALRLDSQTWRHSGAWPPPVPGALSAQIGPNETLYTAASWKWTTKAWEGVLAPNYAALHGIYSANRYDPLVHSGFSLPETPSPAELHRFFERWGISRVVVQHAVLQDEALTVLAQMDEPDRRLARGMSAFKALVSGDGWTLYDTGAKSWRVRTDLPGAKLEGKAEDGVLWRGNVELPVAGPVEWHFERRPGYFALVDGVQESADTGNGLWVSLQLPAGRHQVELHYRPSSLGLALSAALLIILAALACQAWLQGRKWRVQGPGPGRVRP